MKNTKKSAIILAILSCLILLFSCDIPFIGDMFGEEPDNNKKTPPEFYTVTFDSAGGTDVKSINVKPGEICKKPYDPVRSGATFDAWYYNGKPWNFKTPITTDVTLTATWNFTAYRIYYDLSGGNTASALPSSYTINSETIVLPTPAKGDYEFAGWYLDGQLVTEIPKGTSGDLYLVADFYGPNASVIGSTDASARTWDNDKNITVKLTANTTDPLVVRVEIPKQWQTVKVVQGIKTDYISTYTEGEKLMLDITMTPGDENAVITPMILIGEETLESQFGQELANGIKVDKNYFPGFVRKAVTFTIDDGDLVNDTKFLNIVRPAGIVGTFNLKDTSATSPANLLALYSGYEIASHHALHCLPENEKNYSATYTWESLNKKNEVFNSSTADPRYMYKSANVEGLWYIATSYWSAGTPPTSTGSTRWDPVADNETYIKYVDITKDNLESVFGEGSVVGFAAPHGEMNETIRQYLKDNGYLYMRKAGSPNGGDTNGDGIIDFNLPKDRYNWNYNAWHSNLNDLMYSFDKLRDDGSLKCFSFGVHAVDYSSSWSELQTFADKYGNRSDDFYYATNREIFEYEDAVNALQITTNGITNPSDIAVFVTVDGVKVIIPANSVYDFAAKTISSAE